MEEEFDISQFNLLDTEGIFLELSDVEINILR